MFVDETTHFEANGTIIFVASCMNVLSLNYVYYIELLLQNSSFGFSTLCDYFVDIVNLLQQHLPNVD